MRGKRRRRRQKEGTDRDGETDQNKGDEGWLFLSKHGIQSWLRMKWSGGDGKIVRGEGLNGAETEYIRASLKWQDITSFREVPFASESFKEAEEEKKSRTKTQEPRRRLASPTHARAVVHAATAQSKQLLFTIGVCRLTAHRQVRSMILSLLIPHYHFPRKRGFSLYFRLNTHNF